jgi:hypothetical protein
MTRRSWRLLAILTICIAVPALAHGGPLRRLFGPRPICIPTPICEPAPPMMSKAPEVTDTLEGRVVWQGAMPKIEDFTDRVKRHGDKLLALVGPKDRFLDPTWRIDPKTNGVANVFVYLKRPANNLLPIHPDDKIRKQPVVLDAPYLVFEPHVLAYYPEWFDGKDRGPTGQEFIAKNSSPTAMNYRAIGDGKINEGFNVNVPKGTLLNFSTGFLPRLRLKPQRLPVSIQDDIHPWMSAKVLVIDHPYYAITKEDGTFSIQRVPVGMEVQVMAWHEGQGWLFTKNGKTMTLKKGKNTLEIEMK